MTPSTEPLRLAQWQESYDDLESVAAQCAESLRRDPDSVRSLLRLGPVLHRLGRYHAAIDALSRAVALEPTLAEASANLAVSLAAVGRIDDAAAAAARAAALAPEVALVQRNYGDALMAQGRIEAARDAYRRAAALQPEDAEVLNKLACAHRALGDYATAGELLHRATALAPAFGVALVNLGTLEGLRGDLIAATPLLHRALATPALPPDARAEARNVLDRFGEHRRLQPALEKAVRREDPECIRVAVAATKPEMLTADVEFVRRMTARAALIARADSAEFAPAQALPRYWPMLEAHFALHRPEAFDQVREAIGKFERRAHDAGDATADDDLTNHERAVRLCRAGRAAAPDAAAWEAQLRYWHAIINRHRPDNLPGQFKPVPNFTAATPLFQLVLPHAVAGSLRAFYDGPYQAVPPGPSRATLVLIAIGECHAFVNGNGRVARLQMNAELGRAGFRPILMSRLSMARYIGALPAMRARGDPRPIVDLLADASRQTGELLAAIAG